MSVLAEHAKSVLIQSQSRRRTPLVIGRVPKKLWKQVVSPRFFLFENDGITHSIVLANERIGLVSLSFIRTKL